MKRYAIILLLGSLALAQLTVRGTKISGPTTFFGGNVNPLTITTTTLASATINTAYSQTVTATGGVPPYTWSIASGGLPPGLFLNASTGVISGTPTSSTTSNFTIKVADSSATVTQSVAYVTSRENDLLSVVNTVSNTQVATVNVNPGPYRTVVTPDGSTVYNTNGGQFNGNTVTAVDTGTNVVTATIPVGVYPLGITLNGTNVYVGNRVDLTVSVIDTNTNTVTATISGGVLSTGVFEMCNDGTTVYVTNKASSGRVHMIRMSDNTLQGDITVGTQPFGCAYNPVKNEIYVANGNGGAAGTVSVINASTHVVTNTINVGFGPDEIAFTPDGNHAYVTLQSDGSGANVGLGLIDTSAHTQTQIITVGGTLANQTPNGVAVTPDGSTVYTTIFGNSSGSSNGLSVVPTASNTESQLILLPGAFGPNSVVLTPGITTGVGATATQLLALTVNPGPLSITTTSPLPGGTQNTAYSISLQASGGTPPYTWTVTSGVLPAGLTLSSGGTISGTPSNVETQTFTVHVADSLTGSASKSLSLSIAGTTTGTGVGQDPLPTGLGWHDLTGTSFAAFKAAGLCDQTSLANSTNDTTGHCEHTIDDWNGAIMADSANHHWLVWGVGGGHNDYGGNELYGFDLSVAPFGRVFRLNNTTPGSSLTQCNDQYADGRPDARHDYGGIAYDPARDQVFIEGGAHWCLAGGQEGGNTWTLPLTSGNTNLFPSLAYPGNTNWTKVSTAGPTTGTFSYAGAYDAHSGLMWWRTTSFLYSFNFSTNTWTQQSGSNQGGGDYTSSIVINDSSLPASVAHLFITAGFGGSAQLIATDITTPGSVGAGISHASDPGCSTIANFSAPGIQYDPVAKDIVVYNGSGSTYYTISIPNNTAGGWTCTANTNFTTGAPDATNNHNGGMWGFFSYSPYCDCFITLNATTTDLFILRLRTPPPNNYGQRSAGVNTPGGSNSVFNSESFDNIVVPSSTSCTSHGQYECFTTTASGVQNLSKDCTTAADAYSGACSLHWAIPSGTNTNPGEFYANFSKDFSRTFGAGQEFYVQYRIRWDSNMVSGITQTQGDPTKQATLGEGDSATYWANACSNNPGQFTVEANGTTGNTNTFPVTFLNCAYSGGSNAFMQSGYQLFQLPISGNFMDEVGTGCPHYRDGSHTAYDTTDFEEGGTGTCWNYQANEWFTIQEHLKIGTFNNPTSVADVWYAHDGKPARLINNAADAAIPNDNSGQVNKYGKGKFSPYTTAGIWNSNTNAWYDDLIFSTRRIPDPSTGTPNEPDSLAISVAAHVPTISWRVNSNNGTPQDDTGMLVERCTGTVSNCMPSPQSGFSLLSSGTCSSLAAHTSNCADSTAVAGTTYTYRVRATNAVGNSGYAESICFNGSGSNCGGTVTP